MIAEIASIKLPYARFSCAQQQLVELEAIDYFFAKQFTQLLLQRRQTPLLMNNVNTIFHALLALNHSLRAGHSCLPLSAIAGQLFGFASDENAVISHQGFRFPDEHSLSEIVAQLAIAPTDQQAIVFEQQRLYLRRYYLFEQFVLRYLSRQNNGELLGLNNSQQLTACLDELFPVKLAVEDKPIDWQKVAVANALNKTFSVIAGGPGTGKTYTVTKLLAALVKLRLPEQLSMALVAPTGKAAQRLSESISQAISGFKGQIAPEILQAIPTHTQTIHRLLGVVANSPNFRHHQDNKLTIDLLLVDEVSMVDLPLMARLLSALPDKCRVILLGDAQQLPSVAAGSVLADLTPNKQAQYSVENYQFLSQVTGIKHLPKSKKNALDYLTYLTESRRFDGQGGIGQLATAVIGGEGRHSWQLLQQAKDKKIPQLAWHSGQSTWLQALIKQYYLPLQQAQSVAQAFALLSQFRILTPTRAGDTGVEQLNLFVEQVLQANLPDLALPEHLSTQKLYHAKPIMISENDYGLGLFNGDIGIIWQNSAGHLMAMFEQQEQQFKAVLPSRLPQFETVYAMTIHKTQGSEFEHVAMVLPKDPENKLLSRELLYTGITRAKKQLTIQSEQAVWFQGVERKVARYSGFNQAIEHNI